MSKEINHINGSFIALAWPKTQVVKEGKWYDFITEFLGFISCGKYAVGHAALALVNHETGKVSYHDFGRYHTPFQTGRVRGELTDPELRIHTKAQIQNGEITNISPILNCIAQNPANHGDGIMYASVSNSIHIETSVAKVLEMHNLGVIGYSPLSVGSTNCSRFVSQIAKSTSIGTWQKLALQIPYTITPSPRSNIRILGTENCYYTVENGHVNRYNKSLHSLFNMYQSKTISLQALQA